MALVGLLALAIGTIFGIVHLIKNSKSDRLENRNREIELERKELELQKLRNEVHGKQEGEK